MAERKKVSSLAGVRGVSQPAATVVDTFAAPMKSPLDDITSSLQSLNTNLANYGKLKKAEDEKNALSKIRYLAKKFKEEDTSGIVNATKIGTFYPQQSEIVNGKIAEYLGAEWAENLIRQKNVELLSDEDTHGNTDKRLAYYEQALHEIWEQAGDRPFFYEGAKRKAESLIDQYESGYAQQEAAQKQQIQEQGFRGEASDILDKWESTDLPIVLEELIQETHKTSSLSFSELKTNIVSTITKEGVLNYADEEKSQAILGMFVDGELIGGALPEKYRNDPEVLTLINEAIVRSENFRLKDISNEYTENQRQRTDQIRMHSGKIVTAYLKDGDEKGTITIDDKVYNINQYITDIVPEDQRDEVLAAANAADDADFSLTNNESVANQALIRDLIYIGVNQGINADVLPESSFKADFVNFFADGKIFNTTNYLSWLDQTNAVKSKEKQELYRSFESDFAVANIEKTNARFVNNMLSVKSEINRHKNNNMFMEVVASLESMDGSPFDIEAELEEIYKNTFRAYLADWRNDPKNAGVGRMPIDVIVEAADNALARTMQESQEWKKYVEAIGVGTDPRENNIDQPMLPGIIVEFEEGEVSDAGDNLSGTQAKVVSRVEESDFKVGNNYFKYTKKPDTNNNQENTTVSKDYEPIKLGTFDKSLNVITEPIVIGTGNTTRQINEFKDINIADKIEKDDINNNNVDAYSIAQRLVQLNRLENKGTNEAWAIVFKEIGISPSTKTDAEIRNALKNHPKINEYIKGIFNENN